MILAAIDWGQTRNMAAQQALGRDFREGNFILGQVLDKRRVDRYFTLGILSHIVVFALMPDQYQKTFVYISLGMQAACVGNNFRIGLGVRFGP